MPSDSIEHNKIGYTKLSSIETGLDRFDCSKSEFVEYLQVGALADQYERIGQTWLFIYEQKIIGYIAIGMAHMKKDEHEKLNIDTYGNVPALLISHLATHKDYEGKGVGTHMVSWAISKAREFSESIGCRLVILNPENDVIEFYRKLGFTHVPHNSQEYDSMFFDIKRRSDDARP